MDSFKDRFLTVKLDATTGQPLAMLDGGELTDRRTAAASVLAARYLARPESSRLLLLGRVLMTRYHVCHMSDLRCQGVST